MSSPVTADIFFRTDTKTDNDYPVLEEERGEEEDRAVRRWCLSVYWFYSVGSRVEDVRVTCAEAGERGEQHSYRERDLMASCCHLDPDVLR